MRAIDDLGPTLASPEPPATAPTGRTWLRAVTLVLVVLSALTFLPFWTPLVLAAWFANLTRHVNEWLTRHLRGRGWAASILVGVLLLGMLVPLFIATFALAAQARELVESLSSSKSADAVLGTLAAGGSSAPGQSFSLKDLTPQRVIGLAQQHGAAGLAVLQRVFGAATQAFVALFLFVLGAYSFVLEGPAQYIWLVDHAPLERAHTHRLANAFRETGRGLVIGVGLTALAQGTIAGITYALLGVPRALLLAMLTCFAAVIPSFGTALVWVPIAAGLALTGRTVPALILAGVGVVVIGTVDNLLRPLLSRYGRLELPAFVLLVSIFGGLAIIGTWGFILGPLVVRLAKEALAIARDEHAWGRQD
jgi:predicted PurR-regulated permease PerM